MPKVNTKRMHNKPCDLELGFYTASPIFIGLGRTNELTSIAIERHLTTDVGTMERVVVYCQ